MSSLYPSRVMYEELAARAGAPLRIEGSRRVFFRPHRLEDAVEFRARHPGSVIVSGGTELGVMRNKRGLEPAILMSLAGLDELSGITRDHDVLSVGANVTWTRLEAFSRGTLPEIHGLTHRFGSPQIRNVATLVGNIAHGSPVADSICLLLIVGAALELMSGRGTRRVGIEGFYRGPKQTVLAADEIIARILIPLPARDELVKLYKISKRKEMDVSTFRAGIRIARVGDSDRLGRHRLFRRRADRPPACPRPRRSWPDGHSPRKPFARRGSGPGPRSSRSPTSVARGDFRLQLAENILLKFYHETAGAECREIGGVDQRGRLARERSGTCGKQ